MKQIGIEPEERCDAKDANIAIAQKAIYTKNLTPSVISVNIYKIEWEILLLFFTIKVKEPCPPVGGNSLHTVCADCR